MQIWTVQYANTEIFLCFNDLMYNKIMHYDSFIIYFNCLAFYLLILFIIINGIKILQNIWKYYFHTLYGLIFFISWDI